MACRWKQNGRTNLRETLANRVVYGNIDAAMALASMDDDGRLSEYGAGHITRRQFDAMIAEVAKVVDVRKKLQAKGW